MSRKRGRDDALNRWGVLGLVRKLPLPADVIQQSIHPFLFKRRTTFHVDDIIAQILQLANDSSAVHTEPWKLSILPHTEFSAHFERNALHLHYKISATRARPAELEWVGDALTFAQRHDYLYTDWSNVGGNRMAYVKVPFNMFHDEEVLALVRRSVAFALGVRRMFTLESKWVLDVDDVADDEPVLSLLQVRQRHRASRAHCIAALTCSSAVVDMLRLHAPHERGSGPMVLFRSHSNGSGRLFINKAASNPLFGPDDVSSINAITAAHGITSVSHDAYLVTCVAPSAALRRAAFDAFEFLYGRAPFQVEATLVARFDGVATDVDPSTEAQLSPFACAFARALRAE